MTYSVSPCPHVPQARYVLLDLREAEADLVVVAMREGAQLARVQPPTEPVLATLVDQHLFERPDLL